MPCVHKPIPPYCCPLAIQEESERTKNATITNNTAANTGYEAELWQMASGLRDSMDVVE
jgi:hypothetical protein